MEALSGGFDATTPSSSVPLVVGMAPKKRSSLSLTLTFRIFWIQTSSLPLQLLLSGSDHLHHYQFSNIDSVFLSPPLILFSVHICTISHRNYCLFVNESQPSF